MAAAAATKMTTADIRQGPVNCQRLFTSFGPTPPGLGHAGSGWLGEAAEFLQDSSEYFKVALWRSQKRYSASHAVSSSVRLLATCAVPDGWFTGPTLMMYKSRNTVRTTWVPGVTPNVAVLIEASMVMRSPAWG